ncbi:type VII secretion protein EccB [Streptomyces sp. NPDC001514]
MNNKRDQVHAHMFMMGRLTSGMLRADPDAPESPQGRTNRGIVWGMIIAAVIAAGAFVLGLLIPRPSEGAWREDGTVVVEKETGSRYLYLDGRLRPLRNYTSAKLLLGGDLKIETVKASSLAGTPHGSAVGIPGAPERLPSGGQLSRDPWQLCSTAPSSSAGSGTGPVTTLAVAHPPLTSPLNSRQGLFVSGPDGQRYLLWKGSRLRLDAERGAQEALGYGPLKPAKVSGALLSALPAGPDLAPRTIASLGSPGPEVGGRPTRIGQLFRVTVPGGASGIYQLRDDGLAHLTATQAALALGDPLVRERAYGGQSPAAVELGSDVLKGRLAPADPTAGLGSLPAAPPDVVPIPAERQICVQASPAASSAAGTSTSIGLAATPDLGPLAQPSRDGLIEGCLPVGRITVSPSRGVLVRAVGAAGTNLGTTLYLVTDTGVKHRLSSLEAAEALGYGESAAVGLSSLLLSMLPSGPDLSPEAAEQGRAVSTAPRCGEQSPVVAETATPSGSASPSKTP